MLASDLLDRARRIALDETSVRWPLAELCLWLNDGQREVVLQRPSALSRNVVLPLVTGTRQELPTEYIHLLRVVRNVTQASEGASRQPGRVVRVVARDVLDAQVPDWHITGAVAFNQVVKHYVYDEEDPRGFYVYPGNTGTGQLEAIVSKVPRTIAASGDPEVLTSYAGGAGLLDLDDTYFNPLLDFVLYRVHSKDAQSTTAMQRAAAHYGQFANSLGLKGQSDMANSPNIKGAKAGAA